MTYLAALAWTAWTSVTLADDFVLGLNTAPKEHCAATEGICITSVRRGGAAGRAGIRSGDVLLRLGDSFISNASDYLSRIRSAPSDLALDAVLLRSGAIVDVRVSFDASDSASNQRYGLAPIQGDFDVLPTVDPSAAARLALEMKEGETRVTQSSGVLTVLHRSASGAVQISGTIQAPLSQIAGTDIWIVQLRRPSWDEVFFSYSIIEDGKTPAGSRDFRGERAPELAVEADSLRGKIFEETIHSDVLGEDRQLTIYLPPARSSHLPMLLMADGQSCLDFARVAEPLILSGKTRPFAIVGVHASPNKQRAGSYDPDKNRRAQEYLPFEKSVSAERHMRFVIKEVIPWATRKFDLGKQRADRAIVGFSNGGAFAIRVAMEHGDEFADALLFSPGDDGSNRDGSEPGRPATCRAFTSRQANSSLLSR